MPTVEDYFDDDTDLPLPSSSSRHLPNTGQRGALVSEIDDQDESHDELDMSTIAEQGRGIFGENASAPPQSSSAGKGKMTVRDEAGDLRPSGSGSSGPGGMPQINPNTPMGGFMGDMMKLEQAEQERLEKLRRQFGNTTMAADPAVYKGWNTVYPLYFDAKRSIQNGRRVPRKSSVWWPQAEQVAKSCRTLGLPSVLEPDRIHPSDWENPGRVKIQFMKDGRFLNPIIKNRTQLYQHLASQIRQQFPEHAYTPRPKRPAGKQDQTPVTSIKKSKGAKIDSMKKSKSDKAKSSTVTIQPVRLPTRVPPAPHPIPSLDDRLPLHSPVHPTGVAVSAIKRDIETEKENKKKGISGGGEDGAKEKMPKMKRVVVRGPKR